MSMQTFSQRRAKHAWGVVEAQCVRSGFDEFGDQAKKLPMRILTSGLGQSLAFLRAKGKPGKPRDLLERITQGDSDFQRLATSECLAYLEWLVRFADAHKE